jgi:hypothetical protein
MKEFDKQEKKFDFLVKSNLNLIDNWLLPQSKAFFPQKQLYREELAKAETLEETIQKKKNET